jgi:hypothetical protein
VARCAPVAREENPCACHTSNSRGRRVQVGIHERSAEFAFFVCFSPETIRPDTLFALGMLVLVDSI